MAIGFAPAAKYTPLMLLPAPAVLRNESSLKTNPTNLPPGCTLPNHSSTTKHHPIGWCFSDCPKIVSLRASLFSWRGNPFFPNTFPRGEGAPQGRMRNAGTKLANAAHPSDFIPFPTCRRSSPVTAYAVTPPPGGGYRSAWQSRSSMFRLICSLRKIRNILL